MQSHRTWKTSYVIFSLAGSLAARVFAASDFSSFLFCTRREWVFARRFFLCGLTQNTLSRVSTRGALAQFALCWAALCVRSEGCTGGKSQMHFLSAQFLTCIFCIYGPCLQNLLTKTTESCKFSDFRSVKFRSLNNIKQRFDFYAWSLSSKLEQLPISNNPITFYSIIYVYWFSKTCQTPINIRENYIDRE